MAIEIYCSDKENHKYYPHGELNNGDEIYCDDCYKELQDKIDELKKENSELKEANEKAEETIENLEDAIIAERER